jgi:IMP dehydrogenase
LREVLGGNHLALKTIGELPFLPVWVNPKHRATSARILLAGHRVSAIGVIEGGVLLGTLGYEELMGLPEDEEVGRYARQLGLVAGPKDTVRDVADRMAAESLDYMPVVDRGEFLGIVTATMLLKDVARSWDPLTGLSWSDGLRDWGIQQLRDGREVTILFLDLDDFGQYNKKYGHIVGDRVLVKVARYLEGAIEQESDVLVRYGGDEFAIATVRTRRETEELLRQLERGLAGTLVADTDEPVSFSAGIFGGRRSKERENVHYSATLDSLINMASRAAQASKEAKKTEPAVEPPGPAKEQPGEAFAVLEVFFSGDSPSAMTTVVLSRGEKVASGVHTRGEATKVQSVAAATVRALERICPDLGIEVDDVQLAEGENGEKVVTVAARMGDRLETATRRVGADLYRTVSETVVEAAHYL